MQRRSVISLAAGLAMAKGARARQAAIRGSAAYRERMALPPGAVLAVALQDISRADAPAETIAEARTVIEGQVPIAFALPYDPARIQPGHRYAVRATIEIEGKVAFRTEAIHPVLTGGADEAVELRLVRAAEAPTLVGPEWVAEEIGGRGVVDRARTSLAFTADGKVSGSGGCNRIAGSVTVAGETIAFGQMISSMMACAPSIGEQEARFMRVLGQARRWRITPAGKLELLDPAGVLLARLARQ
ncbi:YbaY family lipoprotein [Dankookia sp. GCM10030260]|uniref:YbaY family lipoprotein n=1 Tax=Dankookia sp. GCM10030260 TaxID=3273390 RepID=UPI0036094DC1